MNEATIQLSAASPEGIARLVTSYGLAPAARVRECLQGPCRGDVAALPRALVAERVITSRALEILYEIAACEASGDAEGGLRAAAALRDPSSGAPPERTPELEAALADARRQFGPYALLKEIGRGGMGVVYRAWHRERQRYYALKTMIGHDPDEQIRKRFDLEAETLSVLRHSNIIRVHDRGEAGGRRYYAMDFIEGQSLMDLVAKERPPWQGAAALVAEAALATHFAHTHGVIHRDIKPANILVDLAGRPFLVDFGLARTAADLGLTVTGQMMGSPAWMAPEQMAAEQVDARADIYALGGVLYFSLTGRKPFEAPNFFALMQLVQSTSPPAPSTVVPEVPPDLDRVALTCLEKDPGRRYQTAFELAAQIRALLKPAPAPAPAAPAVPGFLDALTRLFNRRHLFRELEARIPWKAPMGPVSFLLLDLDGFKEVNAKHGRETGDRALAHVAELLRREAGPHAILGRHGGDSFLAALVGAEKSEALAIGERLRELASGPGPAPGLRLSGGVATFPADAESLQLLVSAANRALAAAKRRGGGVAAEPGPAAAGDGKTAAELPCPEMVGRDAELAAAIGLFDDLCNGKTGLLHVRGGGGCGKTRFLREYAARARNAGILHLYVCCDEAKNRVPGYPLLKFLDIYYERRPAAEQTLRLRLTAPRRAPLREYVPAFSRWAPERREALAGDRLQYLAEAVEFALGLMATESPLLLIVDNAGFIDPLSARIAGSILRERRLPLGLALATREDDVGKGLQDLLAAGGSRATKPLPMPPLQYDDVEAMVRAILPGAELPEGFAEAVAEASCGSPLYVEQLLRLFTMNGRIRKDGGRWIVPALGFDELPESVDAAVKSMIAQLPPEAGELLTNAAVMGASFDFRALRAMCGAAEGEMMDLMDQVEEMGLVERGEGNEYGFQAGHLREVRYRAIPEGQRQQLHQKAAEALIEVRGLTAGSAEYHSARGRGEGGGGGTADLPEAVPTPPAEKTGAVGVGEKRFELLRRARLPEGKEPLPPAANELGWTFLGALALAVKTARLYPGDNRMHDELREKVLASARRFFVEAPLVTFGFESDQVTMNGRPAPTLAAGARQALVPLMADAQVGTLTLRSGITGRETASLLKALSSPPHRETVAVDYWDQLLERMGAQNFDVLQRRFVATDEEAGVARAVVEDADRPLEPDEVAHFWEWMRYLKATVDSKRLYPGGHRLVDESLAAAQRAASRMLESAGEVLVSTPEGEVVANGVALDIRAHLNGAAWLAKEFQAKDVKSVAVQRGLSAREHGVLASALAATDPAQAAKLLRSPGLDHVAVDARIYERVTGETIKRSSDPNAAFASPDGPGQLLQVHQRAMSVKDTALALLQAPPEEFLSSQTESALPGLLASLVASPHSALAVKLVERLVSFLKDEDEVRRERAVAMTGRAVREAGAEAQRSVLAPVQTFLEKALESELERPAFRSVVEAACAWLGAAGGAGLHDRIVLLVGSALRRRPDLLQRARNLEVGIKACVRLHEAAISKAARDRMSDSDDPSGAAAARMAAVIGPSMTPALVAYVRQTKDAGLRREGAIAIAMAGGAGATSLAGLVRPGSPPEEAIRLMSILELTGLPDVGAVALTAQGHLDPAVRSAGLNLLRRAPKQASVGSLRSLLKTGDPPCRIAALTVARERKLKDILPEAVALCEGTEDDQVLRYACYFFRECAAPEALPALRRIFDLRSRMFGMRKGLSDETRAAAVEAAARIPHPGAQRLVEDAAKDGSGTVQETARRTRRFTPPA